jgi:hypothetical protein
MIWVGRALIAIPFLIAAVLTILLAFFRQLHLHPEHIAGYGFLFATPWAWLLDHDWFGQVHNQHVLTALRYLMILWIPALLYSCCLWLLFFAFRRHWGFRRD